MVTPELVITALSALGAGAILTQLAGAVVRWFSGRQAREREGWLQADAEARRRRELERWAHHALIQAQRAGLPLPPLPGGTSTGPQHSNTPTSIIE